MPAKKEELHALKQIQLLSTSEGNSGVSKLNLVRKLATTLMCVRQCGNTFHLKDCHDDLNKSDADSTSTELFATSLLAYMLQHSLTMTQQAAKYDICHHTLLLMYNGTEKQPDYSQVMTHDTVTQISHRDVPLLTLCSTRAGVQRCTTHSQ